MKNSTAISRTIKMAPTAYNLMDYTYFCSFRLYTCTLSGPHLPPSSTFETRSTATVSSSLISYLLESYAFICYIYSFILAN